MATITYKSAAINMMEINSLNWWNMEEYQATIGELKSTNHNINFTTPTISTSKP
jgi:hypothetical protein